MGFVEELGRIAIVAVEQGFGFGQKAREFFANAAAIGFGGLGLDFGERTTLDENAQALDLSLEAMLGAFVSMGGAAVSGKDEERAGELQLGLSSEGFVGLLFHPLDECSQRFDGLIDTGSS